MQECTGPDIITKHARPIAIRIITLHSKHITINMKERSCHGKNILMMSVKDISNQKYATIGFCNLPTRNAK